MGGASYAVLGLLFALLVFAIVIATLGWHRAAGVDVPLVGYVALVAGVLFSLLVGVGLMVLVFYSSRAGYDEPAKLIPPDPDNTTNDASVRH